VAFRQASAVSQTFHLISELEHIFGPVALDFEFLSYLASGLNVDAAPVEPKRIEDGSAIPNEQETVIEAR
jgi:hypothetical protein